MIEAISSKSAQTKFARSDDLFDPDAKIVTLERRLTRLLGSLNVTREKNTNFPPWRALKNEQSICTS
jgi:hypothetical protein